MRAKRNFGNPFNNRGQFRGGRGFQEWKEATPDSSSANLQTNEITEPSGRRHVYVGPCRCGRGPHAFYRNAKGEPVHISEIKDNEQ